MQGHRSELDRVDALIDALNAEHEPAPPRDQDEAALHATARLLKSLRHTNPAFMHPPVPRRRRRHLWGVWAAVAAAVMILIISPWSWLTPDPVQAMGKAVASLNSYYGILEKRVMNAEGDQWTVQRLEIWSEGDRYATRDDNGVVTVNNGEQRWQVRPQTEEVVLLPLLPDPRGFDLREEARRALAYDHEVIGQETVADRPALRLRINPSGGITYDLWIDAETKLPLQLQLPMQNALQTTYAFVHFEPNVPIDENIFEYRVPDGFVEVESGALELVGTPSEAAAIAGFEPVLPQDPPQRILAAAGQVTLDYGDVQIIQTRASGDFVPDPTAALGQAAGGVLEARRDGLRWRQNDLEIEVHGDVPLGLPAGEDGKASSRAVAIARQLAPDLTLPKPGSNISTKARVLVAVDLDVAARDQHQVDAGHSPWQLDPRQVAALFVFSEFGVESGKRQPPFDAARITEATVTEATVEFDQGPIARVYLQRLVRQDQTGIWSVVGYDPR